MGSALLKADLAFEGSDRVICPAHPFAEGQEAVCEKDGTPVSAALQRLDARQSHLSEVLRELVTRLDNAGLLSQSEPTGEAKSLDGAAPPPWPLVVSIDDRASFAEHQANRVIDVLRRLAV
jgi:hypothetical protein